MNNLNEMTHNNLLLVVSGPSGAGKSTVLRSLLEHGVAGPGLKFSVSATTRQPRPGEQDGVHYHFVSKEKFEEIKARGDFLEWEKVHESYYGTPASNAREAFDEGKDLLLEIDVKGAMKIKAARKEAVLVFIAAPLDELERRLRSRPENLKGDALEKEIQLRLKNAALEMESIPEYDYLVINENLDECEKKIISIMMAEKCRIIKNERNC